MKAKLIKGQSGRFYIELGSQLLDDVKLCAKSCNQLFIDNTQSYLDVDIDTEYDFNGIGYSQSFKLNENGCLILKPVNEKTPSK